MQTKKTMASEMGVAGDLEPVCRAPTLEWHRVLQLYIEPILGLFPSVNVTLPNNMCLWYVTKCPYCDAIAPMPNAPPLSCDSTVCERKELDPNHLVTDEQNLFLEYDYPCNANCIWLHCGLIIRLRRCGQPHTVRQHCQGRTPSSSESDD